VAKGARQTRCSGISPSPSHLAGHLHERGWPGRLLQPGTWLVRGDGGPSRDVAPAGFCKGKSVGGAPRALPCLQGGGVYRQGAGGLWLGLSLSHFLLLLVLPLPPLTHPPCLPAPTLVPKGQGSLSGTMCGGRTKLAGAAGDQGLRAASNASRERGPCLGEEGIRRGRGPGAALERTRCPRLTCAHGAQRPARMPSPDSAPPRPPAPPPAPPPRPPGPRGRHPGLPSLPWARPA
jgi:hypothetical protein